MFTSVTSEELNISSTNHSARILRDNWGVPHIYGKTDADVSFGLAYAHAEDDFETIQDVYLASLGRLSELKKNRLISIKSLLKVQKKEYQSIEDISFLLNDYYVRLMNFNQNVDENYLDQVPDDVKKICKGYAEGLNLYVKNNPGKSIKGVFPIDEKDIVSGFSHRLPLFMGADGEIRRLIKNKIDKDYSESLERPIITPFSMDMVASNVFAVGPSRSEDGSTRLMINTHQPWSGPVAWYEAHLISDEGWDFFGALFPGSPTPLIGHNPDLGWSHTVNEPDLIDIYKLTLNPENESQYWFDGDWKNFINREVKIKIKIFGPFKWTTRRVVKESVHGPVIGLQHGTYAIRISGKKDLSSIEQWYRMTKANNFSQFKDAMAIQGIPMFNTGYADKEGNIYYVYNAKIPKRKSGYQWASVVPGETSTNLWTEYIPYDSLPQIKNPKGGFIQNCNSTPYLATGNKNEIMPVLPDWTGIETHQTGRALRSLETYGSDSLINRQEFSNYKYDHTYSKNSLISKTRDRYIKYMKNDTNSTLRPALELLEKWDLSADSTNKAAALAFLVLPKAFKPENLKYDPDSVTKKLEESIKFLETNYGSIDPPLGRVFILKRGKKELPLSGGPGLLRAIYYKKSEKKYVAVAGDCYIQLVEWDNKGKQQAWSIHQYGSATKDIYSPHYSDQSDLFYKEKMKKIR
tara:strand:- start:4667 stop:6736 length:2070 start_codon:yes stop_codon:yes gene_type:complete